MAKTIDRERLRAIRNWTEYDRHEIDICVKRAKQLITQLSGALENNNSELAKFYLKMLKDWVETIERVNNRMEYTIAYIDVLLD